MPGPQGGHSVISDSLLSEFSREEVDCVLAHEQAHLRQRHHLLAEVSDALRTALPKRQFAVRFAERCSGLIEMRADCAARLKCGRQVTAQALARWSTEADAAPSGSSCPVAARRHHLLAND
jgi:hypothetical protein